MKKYLLILIVSFISMETSAQSNSAIPLNAYGVWDRSDNPNVKYNVNADYFLGSERSSTWADIQPDGPDRFDFSVSDRAWKRLQSMASS
jgi:hypothetical protein